MRFRLISSFPFLASDETKPSAKTNEPTPENQNGIVIISSYWLNISFNNATNTYLANVKLKCYLYPSVQIQNFQFCQTSWEILENRRLKYKLQ